MDQERIQSEQEPIEKKSKWWIWLIIALIVIGAGIGIYFWLTSGGSLPAGIGSGGILQPPALPS